MLTRNGAQRPQSEFHGSETVVDTACPLDCPDSCSLAVTVSNGRIVEIDGSALNTPTGGYICAKVRKFGDRVYGDTRLQYPAVRTGAKGLGRFSRVTLGRSAGAHRRAHARDPRAVGRRSDSSVFVRRFERAAHQRHARRRAVSAVRRISARADGMRGADRSRGAVPLRKDAVRHLRRLSRGAAHHSVGRQPFNVGNPPRPLRPRSAEARRAPRRDRPALDAAGPPGRPPPRTASWQRCRHCACHSSPSLRGQDSPTRRFCRHIPKAPIGCGRAPRNGRSSARPKRPASAKPRCGGSPTSTRARRRRSSAAVGVSSATATAATRRWPILALPAVGGKFGVRGGGYSMSNSAAWNVTRPWLGPEPTTRIVNMNKLGPRSDGARRSAHQGAVRLQLQPGGDHARPAARAAGHGSRRSLHGRLRSGDDRHGGVRRCHPARHDVSRSVRLCAWIRAAQSAARQTGDRRRRRIAIEPRRVWRAVTAARSAPARASRTTNWTCC